MNRLKTADVVLLLWGKVRRMLLFVFRPGFIARQHASRTGGCAQCGTCCRLPFRCGFLRESQGKMHCSAYRFRPPNCRIFPIDTRDHRDRDRVNASVRCGYQFKP